MRKKKQYVLVEYDWKLHSLEQPFLCIHVLDTLLDENDVFVSFQASS
jgi:hypothetical protein